MKRTGNWLSWEGISLGYRYELILPDYLSELMCLAYLEKAEYPVLE